MADNGYGKIGGDNINTINSPTEPDTNSAKRVARFTYDFAVHGGAVGAIIPRGDAIPVNATAVRSYVDTVTAFTSGGAATVGAGLNTAIDLQAAATAFNAAPWTAGRADFGTGATGAAAAFVKLTAARVPTLTVAGAALTGGKCHIFVEYVVSDS